MLRIHLLLWILIPLQCKALKHIKCLLQKYMYAVTAFCIWMAVHSDYCAVHSQNNVTPHLKIEQLGLLCFGAFLILIGSRHFDYFIWGLFLPEFSSNRPRNLTQWCLGIEVLWYDFFLRIRNSSSGFIQHFLDYYVDRCQFNDVHVGWSPIHWILDQSIR